MRWLSDTTGQMSIELAVMLPVLLVMALILFNLGRYVCACVLFDRVVPDVVLSQGLSGAEQAGYLAQQDAVQTGLKTVFADWQSCEVEVELVRETDAPDGHLTCSLSPQLTTYHCTLTYHPWPTSFVIAGIDAGIPVVVTHKVDVTSGCQ